MTRRTIILLCASLLAASAALADDPGYFLSWQQKKDLLRLGRIRDSAGTWYDVWICPGYSPPARYAGAHLREAGSDFHEYFEANKYHMLKNGSRACINWALEECGVGFTVKGVPRAWRRHFAVAHKRTQRRVFGWWLAYPWAFMESTVESAFRGALGTAGTAGGVLSGVAVVPAYHALDSAVRGVWNLGVNTVILPTAAIAWNTVVGPPLAMIGQKPAESRVDGFWVTVVGSGRVPGTHRLSEKEVEILGQWGLLLLRTDRPYADKRAQIEKELREKDERLRREMQEIRAGAERQRAGLQEEERASLRQAIGASDLPLSMSDERSGLAYAREYERDVRRYLAKQKLSGPEIDRAMDLLRTYQSPYALAPAQVREKTDPLRRGVEVIGESAADTLK